MDNCPHCGKGLEETIQVAPGCNLVSYGGVSVRLTAKQIQFVDILASAGKRGISSAAIYDQLYQLRNGNELPDMKIIDTMLCYIRKSFRQSGIRLKITRNYGWGDANFLSLVKLPRPDAAPEVVAA